MIVGGGAVAYPAVKGGTESAAIVEAVVGRARMPLVTKAVKVHIVANHIAIVAKRPMQTRIPNRSRSSHAPRDAVVTPADVRIYA